MGFFILFVLLSVYIAYKIITSKKPNTDGFPAKTPKPPDETGKTYRMQYQDLDGIITERTVTVRRIYRKNGNTYIRAYCHLRQAERTFMLYRIKSSLVDVETGEILEPETISPIKAEREQAVSRFDLTETKHLHIAQNSDGWELHDLEEPSRGKTVVTYTKIIDAYRTAIRLALENQAKTVCIYYFGKYRPKTMPPGAERLRIVNIDLTTPEGRAKFQQNKIR